MDRRDFLAGAATGAVVAGAAVYAATGKRPAPIETGTPDQPGAAPAAGTEAHAATPRAGATVGRQQARPRRRHPRLGSRRDPA